jgi:membrane fusion protein, multidrug efflux system
MEPKPAPREAASDPVAQPDHHAATAKPIPGAPPEPHEAGRHAHPLRRRLLFVVVLGGLAYGAYSLAPAIETLLNTVSTDDAYVNGHVTFVAPRVSGQVSRVLVDDNYRVKKGALLVQLDKEPFADQVAVKQAAVATAEADLVAAQAQARGLVAQVRANKFLLERAIEDVHTQVANLRANLATLKSREASLELARHNLKRGEELLPTGGISKEDLDQRRQAAKVAEANVDQAQQAVFATRVGLGLAAQTPKGHELSEVPDDLDQNFSSVRTALGQLIYSAALLGYAPPTWDATPKRATEIFLKQDPQGDLDRIYTSLISQAPAIKQAEAKLIQARRDLDVAQLNLRYCDVASEIDGVVTRRNVNPGNNVQAGQSLMAVRSLTEIWIDANFKETQLSELRIGHRVRCEVDMYGSHLEFEGRITGFTMGTGQTLSLLPPQNATGNFVKIVQRLPVRVELTDYDPDKVPLFVGLSVVPYVYYKEPPAGPNAGQRLQPFYPLPPGPSVADDRQTSPATTTAPKGHSGP